jgi:hypothetical protein
MSGEVTAFGAMGALAELLAGTEGGVLLAINGTPEVREMFAEFVIEEVEMLLSIGAADRRGVRRELIVLGGWTLDPASTLSGMLSYVMTGRFTAPH